MNILSVQGSNFLALSDFYLELAERGLVLIQGDNRSDSSADSNGAGKSSIPDAISWALYGVTARGITGDKIVNRENKKNTWVEVTVQDGGVTYLIRRHRKHDDHKNQVFVTHVDGAGNKLDLSKGTDKETQEVINGIMGATVDIFNAAIYAGQEQMPNLPGMTDKNLKLLLEEAAGTEELAECYTVARQRALEATKELDLGKQSLDYLERSKSDSEAMLADAERTRDEFEAGRRDRAKAIMAQTIPLTNRINEMNVELAKTDEPALRAEIAAVEGKIKAVDSEKVELNRLAREVTTVAQRFTGAQVAVRNMTATVEKAERILSQVDDQVGQPCSQCGKAYCVEDLDTVRASRAREVEAEKAALEAAKRAMQKADGEYDAAVNAHKAFEEGMTDVSAEVDRLNDLNSTLALYLARQNEVAAAEGQIARLKADAAARLKEENPHRAHVEAAQKRIETAEAQIAAKKAELVEVEQKAELLQHAVQVFGPAGVRAHILDLITPFLNERTREYLGALSDGNIHAIWSTLTKTAKGELKEKFNIEVTHDLGGDSFDALSGGEKRKVRLATALALQEMVASRATKPIGLFIADEIDDAIDPAGLERLMGILDKRAKEHGSVFLISHNGLADWVDQVVMVEKDGKSSVVTGATHRSF